MIKIANAPCSWGVLEFEDKTASPGYRQVLDEIASTGYVGTELGDWGFMPTGAEQLRTELRERDLGMVGAFVTTRLVDSRSYGASRERAVATASLLPAMNNATGGRFPPLFVTGSTWLMALGIAMVLALAIGLPPALRAWRLKIVEALAGH